MPESLSKSSPSISTSPNSVRLDKEEIAEISSLKEGHWIAREVIWGNSLKEPRL